MRKDDCLMRLTDSQVCPWSEARNMGGAWACTKPRMAALLHAACRSI